MKPEPDSENHHQSRDQCIGYDNKKTDCTSAVNDATIEQARDADWQADANVIGCVIGLLTLTAAGFAAWYAREAARHTEKGAIEAAKSVVQAKRSAAMAKAALAVSRDTARKELRPYVFINDIDLVRAKRIPPFGGPPEKVPTGQISYSFRNSGQTPAKNVRVCAKATIVKSGTKIDLSDLPPLRNMGVVGPTDIFGDYPVKIDGLPDGADIPHLTHTSTGYEIHVWGRIEYHDEFDSARWTNFHCYIGGPVGYDRSLHAHEHGNDYA